ncbi:MAG: ImmA/IrrE family metallo-endopeptidase [Pseudomonadota bacterium]
MDTTRKGDELEDKVYEIFLDNILNDRFWAKSDCCKIYQKKGYYSRDRLKEIIFDIAIEIFLPGESEFSSLVLIECKNYNDKVPVGDVESFLMKAHQVSGGNVKAIVVSNNAFQEGAFNFAESKRMGLLRYYDRNNLEWILHRSPSSIVSSSFAINEWTEAYNGLHKSGHQSKYFDFFGYVSHQHTNSLKLFIGSLVKQGQEKEYVEALAPVETIRGNGNCVVEYREESEIEVICENLLSEIKYSFGEVHLEDICALLKERHNLAVFENSDFPEGVLGKISFDPLEIQILKDQKNEARKRFTLAHELGHFLLGHSRYMSGEKCRESSLDVEKPDVVGMKDVMRMECQANQFASRLLLPKHQFSQTFLSIAARNGLSDRGFGVLYLDHQKCNQDVYYSVTSPLMKRYKVSRKAIKIRLKRLGYINEPSSVKA